MAASVKQESHGFILASAVGSVKACMACTSAGSDSERGTGREETGAGTRGGPTDKVPKTVEVVSLGCPKNLVDTEHMLGILESEGFTLWEGRKDTTSGQAPDLLLINTCGFIEPAKREALDEIARALRRKQRHPGMKIIVAGCLVQRYAPVLAQEFPEIDGFLGVPDICRAWDLASGVMAGQRLSIVTGADREPARGAGHKDSAGKSMPGPLPRHLLTQPHVAYLKISEGCDNRCAYCAIPQIRGPMSSRPAGEVLEEAQALARLGTKEIVVVAQDPTRYGLDTSGRHLLPELVQMLGTVTGVEWIRIMYAHPARTAVLIDALSASPRVCRYADVPVQHASASVLRRMGRSGSGEDLLKKTGEIRARIPGVSLRSTFLVGFPGETQSEFACLLEFIRDAGFEHAGVFKFSPEEGTAAFAMTGRVPQEAIDERFKEATRVAQEASVREHSRRLGSSARVIVDSCAGPFYRGRTEFQAPDIDGITRLYWQGGPLCEGRIVNCLLKDVDGHDFTAVGFPANMTP
jgi:ribosomal protein S12 methylthiotransferase